MFGLNLAFRIRHLDNDVEFIPINNTERVMLDDLIGYEIQKKKLVDNTEAFIKGLPANNVLLCGDAGTGKSTSIKALLNEYYDQGLRMIEIYKHQFQDLSNIISQIKTGTIALSSTWTTFLSRNSRLSTNSSKQSSKAVWRPARTTC